MFDSKYKVVLAEDNEQTRTDLKNILSQFDNVESIVAVSNGQQLVDKAKELDPDPIIVDVEMPELNGIEAVNIILDEGLYPYIIFLTGHSEFALQAFELNAIDYITKPVRIPRLQKAFDKIDAFQKKQEKKLAEIKSILTSREKIFIKTGSNIIFIDVDSIIMVEHKGNKSVIFCKDAEYCTAETLNSLEEKLNFPEFFRSHKGYIINLKYVSQIKPLGNRSYEISFQGINSKALISRSKAQNIFSMLNIRD
ncbi:LytTR family two component transcriptional regulator [Thermincola ferriacetica]|uniref:Stage 0 sporulation protein A homolog n=1 Tax=Thermincola ferriacetica TaxID=281456 RepID=A0A0L6VYW9_9FIRM|nr:LytTR family DNA-binding domain-containing protein [Thermincola ferriacetica]KNZ68450.1 LytTR family two component transcriptional regulator [Thermincola ferriacetica]